MTIVKLQEGFTVDMLKALFTEEEPTPEPGVTPEEPGPSAVLIGGGYRRDYAEHRPLHHA